jgi:beta-glucosidase/6-phospho-beta-glucosidase/beta-galactosidase
MVRYGLPWSRLNPAPGQWDWLWADMRIDALLWSSIAPFTDLLRYGLPRWLQGTFLNPDFPSLFADFATTLAAHFRGDQTTTTMACVLHH